MRTDLGAFTKFQVFLNYPYDDAFSEHEEALHFSVLAAGLIPVTAKDLGTPDKIRLETIVRAIQLCQYSVHELSRSKGEGTANFARMNMPVEAGMAVFYALTTDHQRHRYSILVPTPHEYKMCASDLAGADAHCYDSDSRTLVRIVYEWLREISSLANRVATTDVLEKYAEYLAARKTIVGSNTDGSPSFAECRELMIQMCEKEDWWDFRGSKAGRLELPLTPLKFK